MCVSVCKRVDGVWQQVFASSPLRQRGSMFLGKRSAVAFAELGSEMFDFYLSNECSENVAADFLVGL